MMHHHHPADNQMESVHYRLQPEYRTCRDMLLDNPASCTQLIVLKQYGVMHKCNFRHVILLHVLRVTSESASVTCIILLHYQAEGSQPVLVGFQEIATLAANLGVIQI